MDGYDSLVPSLSFIFVTNTRLINTPTHSDRFNMVGSLQRANLKIDIEIKLPFEHRPSEMLLF